MGLTCVIYFILNAGSKSIASRHRHCANKLLSHPGWPHCIRKHWRELLLRFRRPLDTVGDWNLLLLPVCMQLPQDGVV